MQQMHVAVLRSKFRRQNTRNTSSGALVEVECCKSARHCGWCEAHVEVIMAKTPQPWSTSGSREVDKLHTILVQSKSKHTKHTMFRPLFTVRYATNACVVLGSTRRSQNAKSTSAPEHFWKLRGCKSARRCGAKHMWKWPWQKHHSHGALLEVERLKKCIPFCREAHVEVNMCKTHHHVRTTFGR